MLKMQHFLKLTLLRIFAAILVLFLISCTTTNPGSDYIIVSGGPALRTWENLRAPTDQHDRYAGNFIKSARIRMDQLQEQHGGNLSITWFVYRPAYITREREDAQAGVPWSCGLSEIETHAAASRAKLVWFSERSELLDHLNRHAPGSIAGFEYFGHSNRYAFMFDCSNGIIGVSTCYLHIRDLNQLKRGLFARSAHVQSWGCSTADRRQGSLCMSGVWKRRTGHPMKGAIGKTDYRPIAANLLPIADPAFGWSE